MSYVVLARKYRPQIFSDVIGQEHVTRTLKNAIKLDKISHAYLLTGPRGVGKTTTARIFSKAVNCQQRKDQDPCNICSSCVEITRSESVDIIEIDAASNRGIEEIRKLRENIKFAPANAKYKVYIIDEVHMLTKEAFNAILKTLEEPPPHVIFIMATTEPDKVLDTITSRCQTFHFKLITEKMIKDNLTKLAELEGIDHDDESLWIIARAGNGSIRDAQSIMDQVISYAEGKIEAPMVAEILGIIPRDVLFMYTEHILSGQVKEALQLTEKLMLDGNNLSSLFNDLINHFRNMMFAKVFGSETSFLGISGEYAQKLSAAAEGFSKEQLVWITEFLLVNSTRVKYAENLHVVIDTIIFKLCQRYVGFDDILNAVEAGGAMPAIAAPLKSIAVPSAETKPKEVISEQISASRKVSPEPVQSSATKTSGSRWDLVKEKIKSVSNPLYFALQDTKATLKGKTINVFYEGKLELTERQRKILQEKVVEVMGEGYLTKVLTDKEDQETVEPPAAPEKKKEKKPRVNPVIIEEEEPVVGQIVELFKGRIEKE